VAAADRAAVDDGETRADDTGAADPVDPAATGATGAAIAAGDRAGSALLRI
jgi:hypothetical protein